MMTKPKILGVNADWGRPGCEGKYGGCGWYRIINPLEKIGADVIRGEKFLMGPTTALEFKERGDIWVTRLLDSDKAVNELYADRDFTDSKIVLDMDDEPFTLNEKHPGYKDFIQRRPTYENAIRNADHIIVSTEPIKTAIKHLNSKITVIPNAIDPKIWEVKRKKRTDGRIRIGWFGSGSHLADMPIVLEFMKELLMKYPQVEFHMAGMVFEDTKDDRVFHHRGTLGYEDYPQWVADMDLDIAIAPILDTPFNQAKSNIKWLEHSMLKTPMVLSDVKPYSDSVKNYKTGYLAKSKSQWIKYLSWLIESEEKRKEIGEAAYQAVLKDYLIDKQLPKYEKLFNSMQKHNITVYTSVIGGYNKLGNSPEQGDAYYVAYSDEKSETWDVKTPYKDFSDDRRNSRIQKIMPHLFIDTEYSIYLDGNIDLKVSPKKIVEEFLKDKDIAVFRHVGRDCVYDEADACIGLQRGTPKKITEQMVAYAKKDYPRHAGLCECGVIVRRHTPRVAELNEKWWVQYTRYSERDQLSFPTVFPQNEINQIEGSVWRHPYFNFKQHLK
jgi:glycosyltransferase involved in cell wall biosynthesis